VGASLVVVVDVGVEHSLELAEGGWLVGMNAEPALEGLLEAFDLEAVAAAAATGDTGSEDHAVVGQGGRRWLVVDDGPEHLDHHGAGDGLMGGDRDGVAGVIVQEAEDLHVAAVGKASVGDVRLPALIGELRDEAD
jgi:hypothetical protein